MNTDEESEFDEKVIASLRGALSPEEQGAFVRLVKDDPVKKERSEQLALTYELLSLCAAAESPPAKVPAATLDRLRAVVKEVVKPPPPPWWKNHRVLAVAVLIMLGVAVRYAIPPSTADAPAPPFIEYAMRRHTTSYLDFLGPTVSQNDEALKAALGGDRLTYLEDDNSLADWENTWPPSNKRPAIKVLLLVHGDWKQFFAKVAPTETGQVKVLGRWQGSNFQKTFAVSQVAEWAEAIQKARLYIQKSTAQKADR